MEVIEKKCKPVQSLSAAISEVYTLINMDSRFQYTGDGYVGTDGMEPTGNETQHGCIHFERFEQEQGIIQQTPY